MSAEGRGESASWRVTVRGFREKERGNEKGAPATKPAVGQLERAPTRTKPLQVGQSESSLATTAVDEARTGPVESRDAVHRRFRKPARPTAVQLLLLLMHLQPVDLPSRAPSSSAMVSSPTTESTPLIWPTPPVSPTSAAQPRERLQWLSLELDETWSRRVLMGGLFTFAFLAALVRLFSSPESGLKPTLAHWLPGRDHRRCARRHHRLFFRRPPECFVARDCLLRDVELLHASLRYVLAFPIFSRRPVVNADESSWVWPGRIVDLFGRRNTMLVATTVLGLSTVLCGLTTSMYVASTSV